jgi:polyribonucleotide nucleotidyltransferase
MAYPAVHTVSAEIGGRTLTLETGKLAEQADGAVTVRYGDTLILATVVGEHEAREGLDFFPLTIEYEERMYAAGKIPGGFIKREGRPTEAAILAARLTDRPIRPLFPKGYRAEVQVIVTVLSVDQENDPDILSVIGASTALMLSGIPFNGPVAAARVGYIDGEIILNPTNQQLVDSRMDIVIAGTRDAVMMVEGQASILPEETVLNGIETAHHAIQPILDLQMQLTEKAGKPRWEFMPPAKDATALDAVREFVGDRLRGAIYQAEKTKRQEAIDALRDEVREHFAPKEGEDAPVSLHAAKAAFEDLEAETVRTAILTDGERPDGRSLTEVRPIWCEVGVLPRTHGSSIFTRGQTQILNVLTLGSTAEEQSLDGLGIEESKRYIHQYNFPPFSTGEVKRLRGPGRRDIGHGALAERALLAVLPPKEEWPYTMRLVSETLSSNGSSSMGSVCGSTLSLMDAGVPITAPVAGVAMGLITGENGAFQVLTDIQGIEDHLGDMDFKVAGTAEGVTAIQMDIKVQGITFDIMRKAFAQAHAGRMHILGKMLEVMPAPRGQMSPYAPSIVSIRIDPAKIGMVIGPGGKNIRGLQDETHTKIDIDDDGTVYISGTDQEGARIARERIERMTAEAKVGEIYLGKVVRIMPFGAFVELFPGKDGLVHISELETHRVEQVEDVVQLGDEINVMVTDIDPQGKISLSRKAVLTGEMPPPKAPRSDRGPRGGGGFDRGDRAPRPNGGNFNRGPRRDGPPRE